MVESASAAQGREPQELVMYRAIVVQPGTRVVGDLPSQMASTNPADALHYAVYPAPSPNDLNRVRAADANEVVLMRFRMSESGMYDPDPSPAPAGSARHLIMNPGTDITQQPGYLEQRIPMSDLATTDLDGRNTPNDDAVRRATTNLRDAPEPPPAGAQRHAPGLGHNGGPPLDDGAAPSPAARGCVGCDPTPASASAIATEAERDGFSSTRPTPAATEEDRVARAREHAMRARHAGVRPRDGNMYGVSSNAEGNVEIRRFAPDGTHLGVVTPRQVPQGAHMSVMRQSLDERIGRGASRMLSGDENSGGAGVGGLRAVAGGAVRSELRDMSTNIATGQADGWDAFVRQNEGRQNQGRQNQGLGLRGTPR